MTHLAKVLAFSGTLPFIGGAMLLSLGMHTLPDFVPLFGGSQLAGHATPVESMLTTYALAIVSFMAGSHWGIHLQSPEQKDSHETISPKHRWVALLPIILPIISNAVTLAAWFSFLYFSPRIIMIMMTVCFLVLLIVDNALRHENIITENYYKLRCWVSKIVILSLCVASVFAN